MIEQRASFVRTPGFRSAAGQHPIRRESGSEGMGPGAPVSPPPPVGGWVLETRRPRTALPWAHGGLTRAAAGHPEMAECEMEVEDISSLEDFLGSSGACQDVRTPVTVLSGVLGAGKTTLLKHILEEPHGYRIAVIQNEFSTEMGIEAPLITDASGETFKDIYELPNGCLCCSAKDGLISMLDRLLEERQRFDYVVVEATGTADPESICEIFWVDEGLGSRVYLDGVVTLVDGRNALSTLGAGKEEPGDAGSLGLEAEAAKQVACADVLVLNKADLAAELQRQRTLARLAAMNPTARLLESTYANVPLSAILGIRAFDRGRLATSLAALTAPKHQGGICAAYGHAGRHHGHTHIHSHGSHADCNACRELLRKGTHGIESLLLRGESVAALYDPEKVQAWMADVLWEDAAGGVYRCKGLFRGPSQEDSEEELESNGGKRRAMSVPVAAYALQGVGKLFEIEAAPHVTAEESKFLFIGRGLRHEVLEAGLRGCLCSAGAGGAV